MTDCLFCKIAQGEISSDVVHETNQILAFKDIGPSTDVVHESIDFCLEPF